jgi:hypothetical protein
VERFLDRPETVEQVSNSFVSKDAAKTEPAILTSFLVNRMSNRSTHRGGAKSGSPRESPQSC